MKYVVLLSALLGALAWQPARAQEVTLPDGQVRPLKPFSAIRVGNGIALTLTAGHAQRVEVSAATPDFREHLRTTVTDGLLLLSYDDLLERDNRKLLRTDHKLRVAVTADYLTMLTAGSSAVVTAQGNFAAPDCVLDINSGATLMATGLAPRVLVVRQSGNSTATLTGQAPRLDVRITGGSTLNAQQMRSERGQVEASSASNVRVAVRDDLLAEASSEATIRYLGSPKLTTDETTGGKVRKEKD